MLKQIIKVTRYFLSEFKNKYFNPLYRTKQILIGGRQLKVFKSTFTTIDKDDAWLSFLLRDVRIFFDVGANIGQTSLLSMVYGKPQKVVLIDPNPLALTLAAGNLIMNGGSDRASFINAFVSNRSNEKIKFFTINIGAAGSMYPSHAKTASILNSWFWVSTMTLDEVSETLNEIPDFVKVDVEGAEHLVLLGASRVSSHNAIRFFVEMHSNRELSMEQNATRILDWCRSVDYKAWYLADGSVLKSSSQIRHRGRCHLLLMRSDMEFPVELASIREGANLN